MSDLYAALHRSHLEDREMRVLNALKCLKIVRRYVPFSSVIDFGCGIGGWLQAAKMLGAAKVTGIEGAWVRDTASLLAEEELVVADLSSERLDYRRSFDLCLSIEVAEHLPESAADLFCRNLTDAANVVVFSAALVGQGGVGHINEQDPRYWVDRFWALNFVPLELVRPAISGEPGMYPWLQQNVIAFINYDHLHLQSALCRFALPRRHFYARYRPI
jgi:SAM-dependent methyltransferase